MKMMNKDKIEALKEEDMLRAKMKQAYKVRPDRTLLICLVMYMCVLRCVSVCLDVWPCSDHRAPAFTAITINQPPEPIHTRNSPVTWRRSSRSSTSS